MAEYTPTEARLRSIRHGWASSTPGDYVQNAAEFDRWLAAHDAELRAEVERLRDALASTLSAAADRIEAEERKRDEAQRQVADLRGQIEALAAEYEKPNPSTLAYRSEVARAVRALAGSGEQPGECEHTEHAVRGGGRYGRHFKTGDPAGEWVPCPAPDRPAPAPGDGPCHMTFPHPPHRWDHEDRTHLRWECPGAQHDKEADDDR